MMRTILILEWSGSGGYKKQHYIRLWLECIRVIFFLQLEEWLDHKAATWIENSSSYLGGRILCLNLVKCSIDALRVGDIGADADGLAAAGINFLNNWVVVVWVSSQNYNRVRLCKFPGNWGALFFSSANSALYGARGEDIDRTVPGPTPAMIASALEAIFNLRSIWVYMVL